MGASSSKNPNTAATVSGFVTLQEDISTDKQDIPEMSIGNKDTQKKLSLVSVQCTLSRKNELKFLFYPFYPTEDDIDRIEQGFSPDDHTDRTSPNNTQFPDRCPWVLVKIELTEPEMVKNNMDNTSVGNFVPTLNIVNGLVATKASIQAQWFEKRGQSRVVTMDLPLKGFLLFQEQSNKSLSLEWKGVGLGMEWDIITNPVCYVMKNPEDIFWFPDKSARTCMICYQSFGLLTRKHHCRACGKVVCSTCSDFKNRSEERVCSSCNDREIFRLARLAEVMKAAAEVDELLPRDTEVAFHSSKNR